VRILSNPSYSIGKRFFAASGFYSPQEICQVFEKVTGKQVHYTELSDEVFAATMPGLRGLSVGNAYRFIKSSQYFGPGAQSGLEESLRVSQDYITTEDVTKLICAN
jgi:hypothetical protein